MLFVLPNKNIFFLHYFNTNRRRTDLMGAFSIIFSVKPWKLPIFFQQKLYTFSTNYFAD